MAGVSPVQWSGAGEAREEGFGGKEHICPTVTHTHLHVHALTHTSHTHIHMHRLDSVY